MNHAPTLATHEPITVHIPEEAADVAVGREDIPPPSLWKNSVKVVRKLDGYEAIVHRVDYSTMMFRAYYPEEIDRKTGEKGRFADRTEWEHCRDWNVAVKFTAAELERQEARAKLEEEIAKLDPVQLAHVTVLCDDESPTKALAKLEALKAMGWLKSSPEAVATAIAEKSDGKKR